eukprot:TRINITY_DN2220_c0_g1_i1.p1 TRINITY_DN2220_c0_g1~~TRINITY_DN2220_c0_g1_i1.p1  ORF type:complete len:642 (+),score=129.10 TRINITY_DN2220_c0_g1_i1:43-1968(+)
MSSAARGSVAAQNWAQKRKEQMERAKALREERKHPVASSSYETEAPVRGSAGSRKQPTWSENEAAPEPLPPSQYSNAFEDRPIQSQYTSKASSQSINVRQSVTGQEAYSGRRSTTPLQDHAEQDDAHDNPYATTYSLAHATNSSRPQRAQESRMQNNASTTQQSNSIPTSSRQAPGRSFSPAPAPSAAPASAMNSSFSQQQTATYNRNAYDDRDAAEGSIDEDLSIADIRKMSLDLCKELLLYLLEHHYSLMKSVTKFFAGKGESNPKRFIMMNQREQETQQAIPSKPVLKKTQSARISPVSDAVDEEPHYPQRSKTQGPPSNAHMQSNYASSQPHSARGLNERDVSAPQHADTSLTNRNQNRPAESRRPSDPPANANLNHSLQDNSPHGVYDREPQRSKQTSSAAGQPSNSSSKPATQRTAPSQNSAARPSSPSHSHQGSVDQRYKPQYYQYSEPYQSADLGDEQDTDQPTIKPGRQDTTRSNAVAVSNPSSSQRGLPQTTNQKPTRLDPDPPRPSSRGSQRSVTSPPSRHEEAFEAQEDEEEDFGAAAGGQGLVECPVCGRNFAAERIKVHQKICNKVSTKERKVFDSTKHRLEGEAAQIYKVFHIDAYISFPWNQLALFLIRLCVHNILTCRQLTSIS